MQIKKEHLLKFLELENDFSKVVAVVARIAYGPEAIPADIKDRIVGLYAGPDRAPLTAQDGLGDPTPHSSAVVD